MVLSAPAKAQTYESPDANAQGAVSAGAYSLTHIRSKGAYTVSRLAVPIHATTSLVAGRMVVYDLSDNRRLVYSFRLNRQVARNQKVWVEIAPSNLHLEGGHEYAIGFEPGSNFYGAVYYNDNRPGTVPDVIPSAVIDTLGATNKSLIPDNGRSFGLRLDLLAGMIVSPPVSEGDPDHIPTLSEWAMIGLGFALAGGAVVMIQRRRRSA